MRKREEELGWGGVRACPGSAPYHTMQLAAGRAALARPLRQRLRRVYFCCLSELEHARCAALSLPSLHATASPPGSKSESQVSSLRPTRPGTSLSTSAPMFTASRSATRAYGLQQQSSSQAARKALAGHKHHWVGPLREPCSSTCPPSRRLLARPQHPPARRWLAKLANPPAPASLPSLPPTCPPVSTSSSRS